MSEFFLDWITAITIIVVPAFVDSLWLGIIITFAAAFLIPALRLKAALRHRLWLVLLILICALPFVRFSIIAESSNSVAVQNFQATQPIFNIPLYAAAALLSGAVCISFARLILLAGSCFSLLKLRKFSKEAPAELQRLLLECSSQKKLKRSAKLRITSDLNSPALIGFIRPMILIPENLLAHLEVRELRQILSHELAHLNRYDDWSILIQRILTSLFVFHPAILWIGKKMNLDREIACDDSVIESGEVPRSYALCLTRLAEFASAFVPATIVSAGSQLSRRIDMLLNNKETQRSGFLRVAQISGMIITLGFAVWISQEGSLLAVSNEKDDPAKYALANDNGDSFENAQQRFEEARIKLEQAREEMLAAGEAMRNAQQELRKQETGINRKMKLSTPESPSVPLIAPPPPAVPHPEAPPAIAPPAMKRPLPPIPESGSVPVFESVPAPTPVPDTPPSFKVHDDRIK